jgi:hypothetical protein
MGWFGRWRRHWFGLGYALYQHLAGVLGALALAAVLQHLVHVGWQGALADLVSYWSGYVRPGVRWVLELIVRPLRLLGWDIAIPAIVVDYVSVGSIFALSVLRALHRTERRWSAADLSVFILCFAGWPAYVPLFGWISIRSKENRRWMLLALLPIAYLILLLTTNYILGIPG